MSTYLLAYVVGEFDYVEDKTSNGVVVRVYTPLGKSDQGRFALDVAVKTLPFYDGTQEQAIPTVSGLCSPNEHYRLVRHSLSFA